MYNSQVITVLIATKDRVNEIERAIKSTLNQEAIDNLHSSHALIITNKNNISYDDIIKISQDIQSKVYKEFNILLEIEPTII